MNSGLAESHHPAAVSSTTLSEVAPEGSLPDRARDLLDRARRHVDTQPVELTVRELLDYWGAKRRGWIIVQTITEALDGYDLATDPPFEEAWIDEPVRLVKLRRATTAPQGASLNAPVPSPEPTAAAGLRVRHLRSANRDVSSVGRESSLATAQALMLKDDYGQLAVVSGTRTLFGAISWKSIAQAQLRDKDCSLLDAIIPVSQVAQVSLDDELIPLIPMIVAKEFVFVRRQDSSLGGIITMADLSLEYDRLARPFFLIGEVERRLRRRIGEVFSVEELQGVRAPSQSGRPIQSADDLTFGEYQRVLEQPDNWGKVNWNIDRAVFIKSLDEVRQIRNEVMHFSPDPIDEEQLSRVSNFIGMVKVLDPRP